MTNIIYSIIKFFILLISPFIIMIIFFIILGLIKGKRFKKGKAKKPKKRNLLLKLFFDFPNRFVKDLFNKDPDYFAEYGVHVIAGEQGSGKTITLAYMLRYFKTWYPLLKVKTNFGYRKEDAEIKHWKDLVASENGIYGEIDCLDEVQNWFNSLASKDFPPEMMTEITQQRKQRKCIMTTSQVFTRIAKPIREQTYLLYEPMTIMGALTIVRVYKTQMSADGLTDKKKLKRIFCFVHDDDLRDSFDTYHKIEKMIEVGFKNESDQIRNQDPNNINISAGRKNIKIAK